MLKPIGDRVLVKPDSPEQKSKGGIILSSQDEEKQDKGTIVSIGDGEGVKKFKEKDIIIFEKYGPVHVKLENVEYVIIFIDEILGRIE